MTHTVIIYEEAGADPATDRIATRHGDHATTIVATGDGAPDSVARLAVELVDHGADVVELCGGMGPVPHAATLAAVGGRVPVGSIMFGFESLTAGAAYKAGFSAGDFLPAAFVVLVPGSDPAVDRTVREDGATRTTFVAVPDAGAAVATARDLVRNGARLLELYGGLGPDVAARILEETGGEVPVGVVSMVPPAAR